MIEEKFKEWAENAIALQQQDIDRIGGVVDRIEKGMKSFRDFMGQVRTDIAITRQESLTDDDLMLVRKDLNGFRDELATHNQQQAEINARMTAPDVSAHEFHTLSTDVQKVNHKASQVDNLKSELNYLKSRLEILESKALSPLNINEDEVFLSIGTPAPDKIWASKKSDESSGGPARQLISNWTSLHEHAGLDHELDAALPKVHLLSQVELLDIERLLNRSGSPLFRRQYGKITYPNLCPITRFFSCYTFPAN